MSITQAPTPVKEDVRPVRLYTPVAVRLPTWAAPHVWRGNTTYGCRRAALRAVASCG